jgi:CRP-like cAMP-binding protein
MRQKEAEAMANKFTKQQLQLVASTFLFRNVDEVVVERLISDEHCIQQSYQKGAVIYDEMHFLHCMGILLSGAVQVAKRTCDGKKLIMSRLTPGECFGAAAMFHRRNRYATILTAEKPTTVLFVPEELIVWSMRRDPVITENYITYLSDRIWFLNTKISALTAGSAEQRLAVFLLEQGSVSSSMTDLSHQLNVGRASLYRALDVLEANGYIRKGSKSIEVMNEDGLRQLAFPSSEPT